VKHATTPPRELALALLPLPDLDALTEQQRSGHACVWDGIPLLPETAVNLGPQETEDGRHWFPQGCRRCVGEQAYKELFNHAPHCQHGCQGDPAGCGVGRELTRLAREGRR